MAENFKEMLEEQKKTNQLLVKLNEDPSLGSSIKQNLGEILNASRLAEKSEVYQKKEGITEVDEAQKKTTEKIKEFGENQNKKLTNLVGSQKVGDKLIVERLDTLVQSSLPADEAQLESLSEMTPASVLEEEKEKKESLDKRIIKRLEGLGKSFKDFRNDFSSVFRTVGGFGGGLLGKLAKIGLFAGLLTFLTSENFMKFAKIMDERVLPFLKSVTEKVIDVAGPRLKKLMDDIDSDKSATEVLKENATTILGAVALLYSRTITAFALSMGLIALKPKNIVGFGAAVAKVVKDTVGYVTGKGGFLRATGLLGVVLALNEGIQFALSDEAKEQRDKLKKKEGTEFFGISQLIGGILASIPNLGRDFLAFLSGAVGAKEQEEAFKSVNYSQMFAELYNDFAQFLGGKLFQFARFIRVLLFGRSGEDIKSELETETQKLESLIAKGEQTNTKRENTRLAAIRNTKKKIEELQKKREEQEKSGGNVGGLFKFMENNAEVIDSMGGGLLVKPDKVNFRGGFNPANTLALVGEGPGGRGGELIYTGSDAMVMNQSRTDQLLTMALEKGLSGGGGGGGTVVVSSDNSVKSNTSNMISSPPIVTSNDTFTNAIASSV